MGFAISRITAVFLLFSSISFSAQAADPTVDITPDFIVDIAKGFGSAVLQTDAKGGPLIYGRIKGKPYAILLYGCERDSCSLIQLLANFRAPETGLERVNDWNAKNRFGKASLSQGKVLINQPVVTRFGLPRRTLERHFVFWELILEQATTYFEEQKP